MQPVVSMQRIVESPVVCGRSLLLGSNSGASFALSSGSPRPRVFFSVRGLKGGVEGFIVCQFWINGSTRGIGRPPLDVGSSNSHESAKKVC
jgi:hypothetical protein